MRIATYKTPKVRPGDDLFALLDAALPQLSEQDIVVITSKIVSLCEGRVVPNDGSVTKRDLIIKEADYYLESPRLSRYGVILTIKNGILIANAGIDESNGGGYCVLWPKDPFKSAAAIWQHLRARNKRKELGIILSDSHIMPLRWGTRGIGIAWCGFLPLRDYIGTPDIFGRSLRVTKMSLIDGLASAAAAAMGEGNEQTPLAVISDAPRIVFASRPPSAAQQRALRIAPADDMFAPVLTAVTWKRGVR